MRNTFLILAMFLTNLLFAQQVEAVKNPNLPYQFLLHYPQGYKENPTKKYPLLIFLHGRSLSGTDLEKVKSATEALMNASQQFTQRLYEAAAAESASAGAAPGARPADDDVVDAEIVDDGK